MTRFAVCIDGNGEAMFAARCTRSLLRPSDTVSFVAVVHEGTRIAHRRKPGLHAERAIGKASAIFQGCNVSSIVLDSPSSSKRDRARALHEYCDTGAFDIIAVGRHEHTLPTQLLIGSVSAHLVAWCRNASVLVVPPHECSVIPTCDARTIAWCVDGSELSLHSAPILVKLAREKDVVDIVHVNRGRSADEDGEQVHSEEIVACAADAFAAAGGDTTLLRASVTSNKCVKAGIVECVTSAGASLIAISHASRATATDVVIGSVTQDLLTISQVPVLVCH